MTYREALIYLNGFADYEKKNVFDHAASFKLERMERLVSLLGDPQKDIKSIHISGTKGKGSTAAMIHSILKAAGYRSGLYTSPHLVSFRERIRIGEDLISEEDVCLLLDEVRGAVSKMRGDDPTFFEVYTALAFLYFRKESVDFAVFEVGLGGRLDATNVIEPLVSVITPISYDHTRILGKTLTEIAKEKAGIIKRDSICVCAPQEEEALKVIESVCEDKGSKLILVGRDIDFKEVSSDDEETVFDMSSLFGDHKNVRTRLLGAHQIVNAVTAAGAVESLRLGGISVGEEAIVTGLRLAAWPGRLEIVRSRSPRIVLDGAQNGASADALARAVRKIFKYRKLILVLGISKDKDIRGILKELVPVSDGIILTKSANAERAMEPEEIGKLITPEKKISVVTACIGEALDKAMATAGASDLVLVTGSLFVVGEARKLIVDEKIYG